MLDNMMAREHNQTIRVAVLWRRRLKMAIYEYYCRNCKQEFELMRPIGKANEPAKCPKCGGEAEKLPSVFGSTAGYSIKVPDKKAFRKHDG